MSSDRLNAPSTETETTALGGGALVETRFVPQRYEPNYAYPLLVLFHGRGGDEQLMARSMPAMSWRNYVGLSLRGPERHVRKGRADGFGWGPSFARPDRHEARSPAPAWEAELFRRRLRDGAPDAVDRDRGQRLLVDPPDAAGLARAFRADLPRGNRRGRRPSRTASA